MSPFSTALRYNFPGMSKNTLESKQESKITKKTSALVPTAKEFSVLSTTEKIGFKLMHRMNQGAWKKFWTFCQRHIGSLWIYLATYNLMNVFGLKNIEKTSVDKPLLLVANHRSFFDMYTVSSILFRRTKRPIKLFFPVRAKFFYTSPLGWFVNFIMGWFSMYPPFFREEKEVHKREFDKYSLRRLIQISSEGSGHIIGFHPEGKRNLNENPHTFLPAQPGVGAVIMKAQPQVIPVFIAGLGNDLPKQILGNWTDGEKVRIWFGEPIDLSEFYEKSDRLRTHKEIADFLMEKIGELAEKDRKKFNSANGK
ncbi:MAG: lysophospholipid acyltransferase family protein [Pyrinomonadaceae bacterium]